MSDFKGRRFPTDIILVCVRWYCKFGISYRDLEDMMSERGVFLVRAGRLSEVIMDDHRPTSSGRAGIAELEAGNARRESPRGADALKRLESERGLLVQEGTRDQVRRALEAAGVLFIDSDRGHGVMLLNEVS
jgi:hypothetical protein